MIQKLLVVRRGCIAVKYEGGFHSSLPRISNYSTVQFVSFRNFVGTQGAEIWQRSSDVHRCPLLSRIQPYSMHGQGWTCCGPCQWSTLDLAGSGCKLIPSPGLPCFTFTRARQYNSCGIQNASSHSQPIEDCDGHAKIVFRCLLMNALRIWNCASYW